MLSWIIRHFYGAKAEVFPEAAPAIADPVDRRANTPLNRAEAHKKQGNLFLAKGDFVHAEECYRQSISADPGYADAYNNLGNALQAQGRMGEAIASYRQILSIKLDFAEAHLNLGAALQALGQLDEAAASYRQVLSIRPDDADAHNNLGSILKAQGKLEEAVASYRQALSINPDFAEAYYNLGNILQNQGQLDDAIGNYQHALSIKPNYADAHYNLGNALHDQGWLDDAIASYRQALSIKPGFADAHNNLGVALQAQGRLGEAAECYRQALLIKSDYVEAHTNLGNVFKDKGQLEEAVACYRQALSINTDFPQAYSNLLLTMQYMGTATPAEIFAEHQRYAERFEAPHKAYWQPHRNNRHPERRLRIGYVSGDFWNHAVAFFIEPVLACHDKSRVEVYCYYNNTKHDNHTEQIASHADHWLACAGMGDEQLAERIRADGIDILVDLSGHTAHNRLPVFARKPAPIQVTWIGYAGTTGLSAMDYRITEAYMDPPGLTERYNSETLTRLPHTGAAYRPEPGCPPVNPLPALTSGKLVFASLNNLTKINQSVVNLWGRILAALPHARLMLGNVTDSGIRQRLIEMFGTAGIAAERLILQPRLTTADYLALHHQIDLALDTFPYNGGTTTIHSLWMGVPVITLAGGHMASRCGVALLSRAGLGEFIAYSEEEYLQRAIQFAQDLPGLNRVRQSLRERMSGEDCNPEIITRHMEAAYREMWRKWCEA